MAAGAAIDSLVNVLRTIPVGVIASERVVRSRPAGAGAIPAIAVFANDLEERPAGIGAFVAQKRGPGNIPYEATGGREIGSLTAEIWTAGEEQGFPILQAAEIAIASAAASQQGFLKLRVRSAGPATSEELPDQSRAMRLSVVFSIVHEQVTGPPEDGGQVIQRVEVELTGELSERMEIP